MLLVRFSFCECGSIVRASPWLAQRSVCADKGAAASHSGNNTASVHRVFMQVLGSSGARRAMQPSVEKPRVAQPRPQTPRRCRTSGSTQSSSSPGKDLASWPWRATMRSWQPGRERSMRSGVMRISDFVE